jgi:hypothetical protein
MLEMPHVFVTAEGRGRWDTRARANIAWEIGELTARQGVLERWVSAIRRVMRSAML